MIHQPGGHRPHWNERPPFRVTSYDYEPWRTVMNCPYNHAIDTIMMDNIDKIPVLEKETIYHCIPLPFCQSFARNRGIFGGLPPFSPEMILGHEAIPKNIRPPPRSVLPPHIWPQKGSHKTRIDAGCCDPLMFVAWRGVAQRWRLRLVGAGHMNQPWTDQRWLRCYMIQLWIG